MYLLAMPVFSAWLLAVLFRKRYLYYMLGCEMWFVLSFIGVGNILCCVTGKIWAEGVWEQGAVVGIWV